MEITLHLISYYMLECPPDYLSTYKDFSVSPAFSAHCQPGGSSVLVYILLTIQPCVSIYHKIRVPSIQIFFNSFCLEYQK